MHSHQLLRHSGMSEKVTGHTFTESHIYIYIYIYVKPCFGMNVKTFILNVKTSFLLIRLLGSANFWTDWKRFRTDLLNLKIWNKTKNNISIHKNNEINHQTKSYTRISKTNIFLDPESYFNKCLSWGFPSPRAGTVALGVSVASCCETNLQPTISSRCFWIPTKGHV